MQKEVSFSFLNKIVLKTKHLLHHCTICAIYKKIHLYFWLWKMKIRFPQMQKFMNNGKNTARLSWLGRFYITKLFHYLFNVLSGGIHIHRLALALALPSLPYFFLSHIYTLKSERAWVHSPKLKTRTNML